MGNTRQLYLAKVFITQLIGFGLKAKLISYIGQTIQADAFCRNLSKLREQRLYIIVAMILKYHRQAGTTAFHHSPLPDKGKAVGCFN